MTAYLDTNVVIYFVEQHPVWGPKVVARIAAIRASGNGFAVSDLTRMECQVGRCNRRRLRRVLDQRRNFLRFLRFGGGAAVLTLVVPSG